MDLASDLPSPAGPPPPRHRYAWIGELWRITLRHPWLLTFTVLPNILYPAITPATAWMAKWALENLQKTHTTIQLVELRRYLVICTAIVFLQVASKLFGKMVDKAFDVHIKVDLQRICYERRQIGGDRGRHVAGLINDCEQARQMFDFIQEDVWQVVIGIPAVLIWQHSIGPGWMFALLLAIVPRVLLVALSGGIVQRWSKRSLEAVADIGGAAGRSDTAELHTRQREFVSSTIKCEFAKQFSRYAGDFAQYLGLFAVIVLAQYYPILPSEFSAGEFAAFLLLLKNFGKPLEEFSKLYAKVKESYPAVIRVLYPEPDEIAPTSPDDSDSGANPDGAPAGIAGIATEPVA